jgi:hypothetical protein
MFFYNYALSQYIFVLQVARDSFYTFGNDPKADRFVSQEGPDAERVKDFDS